MGFGAPFKGIVRDPLKAIRDLQSVGIRGVIKAKALFSYRARSR